MQPIGPLVTGISQTPTSSASNASSENGPSPGLCSELQAAKAARALQGQWRRAQFDDPEVFYAAMKRLFVQFTEDIVAAAVAPRTGLAGKHEWPPSQAQVVTELNRLTEDAAAKERRQRDREDFLRLTAPAPIAATPEERERAVKYWLERVRPTMQGHGAETPTETPQQALARLCAEHGVSPASIRDRRP